MLGSLYHNYGRTLKPTAGRFYFLPLLTTRDKERMVRRVGFEPTVFTLRVADLQSAGLAN